MSDRLRKLQRARDSATDSFVHRSGILDAGTPGFQINQRRHDIDDDIYGDGSKPGIET